MQIGMIGLGRMGASMTTRLLRGGHDCVIHDRELREQPPRQRFSSTGSYA